MSKNSSARTLTAPASQAWGARNLAYCALLAALSIVFARLIIPMPNETTRFSIEAVPIFLAGLFFGPSASLTLIYAAPDARAAFFLLKLATRGIQFSITWVIDVLLVHLLFQCKLFDRAGLWPPKRAKAAAKAEKGTEAL